MIESLSPKQYSAICVEQPCTEPAGTTDQLLEADAVEPSWPPLALLESVQPEQVKALA